MVSSAEGDTSRRTAQKASFRAWSRGRRRSAATGAFQPLPEPIPTTARGEGWRLGPARRNGREAPQNVSMGSRVSLSKTRDFQSGGGWGSHRSCGPQLRQPKPWFGNLGSSVVGGKTVSGCCHYQDSVPCFSSCQMELVMVLPQSCYWEIILKALRTVPSSTGWVLSAIVNYQTLIDSSGKWTPSLSALPTHDH